MSKCKFMASSDTYFGYQINRDGLHPPMAGKVQAMNDAPSPRNITELKSYLGLLTYYRKFIPNMSTTLAPLAPVNRLLCKDVEWK